MMFKTKKVSFHEDAWDARQRLVAGWDAEAIKKATILVIGAGAIGNETIKNLALLGFGNVVICDLDTIETSNLTRTVLFNQHDVGKKKASLAAERMLEMNLESTACADSFDGDIVYELGDGVFRRATVVVGCLDNVETRMHVNRICMRYDIPYVDAGIGSLGCTLQVMNGHNCGCYACYAPDYKYEDRFRMSCDATKKKAVSAGKMPTVQTASAIVAGMQVQEVLKIVCGMNPQFGVELHFQGTANMFNKFNMPIDPNCMCHMSDARQSVMETAYSYKTTLREFLQYTTALGFDVLTMEDEKLGNFITKVKCPNCGCERVINQPMYKIFSNDFYCGNCRKSGLFEENFYVDIVSSSIYRFSLAETPDYILDMTLENLGIPAFHVVATMNSATEEYCYFELSDDIKTVMPNYFNKNDSK